jgi:PhoH-like ATPase
MFLRKQTVMGSVSNELGFLPGSKEDKLAPWLASMYDNLEVLCGDKKAVDSLMDTGVIEFESLGMMRGRSIPNTYLIIDEAQNLDEHEMRTILTRAGEGTKIILLGDTQQIDTKGLTEFDNGLALASTLFKDWERASSMVLKTCVRSRLADKATEVFE